MLGPSVGPGPFCSGHRRHGNRFVNELFALFWLMYQPRARGGFQKSAGQSWQSLLWQHAGASGVASKWTCTCRGVKQKHSACEWMAFAWLVCGHSKKLTSGTAVLVCDGRWVVRETLALGVPHLAVFYRALKKEDSACKGYLNLYAANNVDRAQTLQLPTHYTLLFVHILKDVTITVVSINILIIFLLVSWYYKNASYLLIKTTKAKIYGR